MVALEEIIVGLLAAAIRMSTSISLAAIGEIYAEKSGVINLGCEGMMLMGALSSAIFSQYTGNNIIGILFAGIIGGLFGLLMALLSVRFGTNQLVNGISISILGFGLSSFLFRAYLGETSGIVGKLDVIPIPILSEIPIIGQVLFRHHAMVYMTFIALILSGLILFRTTLGLNIRAVGENPRAADSLGINVYLTRYLCLTFAGAMAGIGGAALVLGDLGSFGYGVTAGRGWIAVALVILSNWNPYRLLGATLIFTSVDALQLRLQNIGTGIPPQFLLMLPYILVIVLLTVIARKARAPASLGKPYTRE